MSLTKLSLVGNNLIIGRVWLVTSRLGMEKSLLCMLYSNDLGNCSYESSVLSFSSWLFRSSCFSFVILLFLFTLRHYCTIHWIISMEEPGGQCDVVVALIVMELASGCVCVCGRGGIATPPPTSHSKLCKDDCTLFIPPWLYFWAIIMLSVVFKILFVSGRTLLEKPSRGDRLCTQQRCHPAPCRPFSHRPAAPS